MPQKPVVFACPASPEYKQASFGSVKVGEEFTLPGDPDEVEYKKINARGGLRRWRGTECGLPRAGELNSPERPSRGRENIK